MSGWLICDKHGGQPPFYTCIHVKKAISLSQEICVYQLKEKAPTTQPQPAIELTRWVPSAGATGY